MVNILSSKIVLNIHKNNGRMSSLVKKELSGIVLLLVDTLFDRLFLWTISVLSSFKEIQIDPWQSHQWFYLYD